MGHGIRAIAIKERPRATRVKPKDPTFKKCKCLSDNRNEKRKILRRGLHSMTQLFR
jgi:hypothetical protein